MLGVLRLLSGSAPEPWQWVVAFAALPAGAYLCGSIPVGVLLARAHGVDLRKVGSGNVGATNVGRALGRRWGVVCFLLDAAKGAGPVLAAGWLLGTLAGPPPSLAQQGAWLLTGGGSIVGHVFPVWLGLRGGKGVATSLGVVLGLFPYFTWPGLCAFATWVLITALSRYVSLGSVVAAVAFLGFFAGIHARHLDEVWLLLAFASVIVVLILFKHRANIRRLLAGTEHRIGADREA